MLFPPCAGVQLQGVLDQLFCYSGPLGAEVGTSGVAVRVWAPTAQQVASYLRNAVSRRTKVGLVALVTSVMHALRGW